MLSLLIFVKLLNYSVSFLKTNSQHISIWDPRGISCLECAILDCYIATLFFRTHVHISLYSRSKGGFFLQHIGIQSAAHHFCDYVTEMYSDRTTVLFPFHIWAVSTATLWQTHSVWGAFILSSTRSAHNLIQIYVFLKNNAD